MGDAYGKRTSPTPYHKRTKGSVPHMKRFSIWGFGGYYGISEAYMGEAELIDDAEGIAAAVYESHGFDYVIVRDFTWAIHLVVGENFLWDVRTPEAVGYNDRAREIIQGVK